MSAPVQKAKKQRNRPSKSRPVSTASISHPTVEEAWSSSVISAFSSDARYFAFLSLAVNKHILRVFDTDVSWSVADHVIVGARVTSLAWISCSNDLVGDTAVNAPSKKRKTGHLQKDIQGEGGKEREQVIALGLSNGTLQLYSPARGRVLKTFSATGNTAPVVAITEDKSYGDGGRYFWTSSANGFLHLWDISDVVPLVKMHEEGRSYTALAACPVRESDRKQVLAAGSSIHLLSVSSGNSQLSDDSLGEEGEVVCTFGGHASSVKSLLWQPSASSKIFCSCAEDDRFVYVWQIQDSASSKGDLLASLPLDSNAIQIDVCNLPERRLLLALSSSNRIVLSDLPAASGSADASRSAKSQTSILRPCTIVNLSKNMAMDVRIAAASFLPHDTGKMRIALVRGGAKVAFETLDYVGSSGECIAEITVKPDLSVFNAVKASSDSALLTKRYAEPPNASVATGETAYDPSLDAPADREAEGALDADLAELSLGERLAARASVAGKGISSVHPSRTTEQWSDDHGVSITQKVQIPAHSLTRTLIQALHAGDTSLLEACLTHSDETLIRNTVTRLPSQLSISLLVACAERLGRGPRGNNVKGRGGGASAQRGSSLIKWVRAVLIIHSGHLMTMPDLVARLSHLYSTLNTRLTLQDRLLSLSGRLDLVLAQVELRSSNAPAPLASKKTKPKKRGEAMKEPLRYIEGESSEEEMEEQEGTQIDIEEDDESSVEDVELGSIGEEESEEEGSEEEEDEEETNLINGFVDDEAEEDYDDDSSEENSG